jgi:uncharacterized membrane protein YphA (DoxX/SURF4 family)
MYEPIWFYKKSLSAVVEAAAGLLALIGLATTPSRVGAITPPDRRTL